MLGLPEPSVRIGFPADPSERLFILDYSVLDGSDVLAPDDAGFVDVTDRLDGDQDEPIHIVRGRSSPLGDYERGRCTLWLRNDDGRFDSLNLDGEYVLDGVTLVKPRRRVWVQMGDEDRFYGFIESFHPDVSLKGWPLVRIECDGAMALISTFDPDAVSPVGASEDSGARIHRILDNAGIADGDRDIATGDSTLQPTTLAQNALTECRLVAASESPLGGFYENRHGQFTFDNRGSVYELDRQATVQATFGPPGVADTLPYKVLVPAFDMARLRNDITAARAGGAEQTSEDAASIASFFPHREKRTDLLLETDAEAADWADWLLALFSEPEYRYDSVTVDALACTDAQLTDMVAALETRELRDRIAVVEQITYRDPDTNDDWVREHTAEVFIDRIEEWIGPASWRMTFGLTDATAFTDLFILDVSVLDGPDRLALF